MKYEAGLIGNSANLGAGMDGAGCTRSCVQESEKPGPIAGPADKRRDGTVKP
jgi:hypothetical protein